MPAAWRISTGNELQEAALELTNAGSFLKAVGILEPEDRKRLLNALRSAEARIHAAIDILED